MKQTFYGKFFVQTHSFDAISFAMLDVRTLTKFWHDIAEIFSIRKLQIKFTSLQSNMETNFNNNIQDI